MSKDELQHGLFIVHHRNDDFGEDALGVCQDLLCDTPGNADKTKEKVTELLKYRNLRKTIEQMTDWEPPKFPVSGFRLAERGVSKGPKFAMVLQFLRQKWKESRYTLSENELLEFVNDAKQKFVDQAKTNNNK